jgi:signal transduction histidine kinase
MMWIMPAGETPGWLQTLMVILEPNFIAQHLDQARQIYQTEQPHVVIATETDEAMLAFFMLLGEKGAHNPTRVLISEQFEQPTVQAYADMVLPPQPRYAYHQLLKILQQRADRVKLEANIHALTKEILTLKAELDSEKKSGDEIALLKSAIIRNVSHELRTPLLQVKSAVALLAEDSVNSKLAEYALDATARLEAVVKNITQLANSMDDMTISVLLVRECVESAMRNLRRTWKHKDDMDRIRIHLPAQLPPALGDRQNISTALQLLIDNALKFSKETVEVSAQHIDNRIFITVKDYGIGIPENKFDDIFQTFYQVDSSSTRQFGGMGVGLAIVQLILERHNAKVHVESEVGKGSTFAFYLPIADIDR